MDLTVHQYFHVFFIKIWLDVYFKGTVGMILVEQVKDLKTFHKLPQNEALPKNKPHSCGPPDTTMNIWARILHYSWKGL